MMLNNNVAKLYSIVYLGNLFVSFLEITTTIKTYNYRNFVVTAHDTTDIIKQDHYGYIKGGGRAGERATQ